MSDAVSVAVVSLDTPELGTLPPSKAQQIRDTFVPMADMLQGFEGDFRAIMDEAQNEEAVTPELSARARRLRLDIAKVRIAAEKARKAIKEEYLLASKAIDGTNNILKWAISQKEDALAAIEKIEELREAERLEFLQAERADLLAPYVEDAHERDLSGMDDDVWDTYLAAKKKEHNDRLEAERRAEEERAEAERVRAVERERSREASPFYDWLPEDTRDALGTVPVEEYTAALAAAKGAKAAHLAEQERIAAENARLVKAREAAEKKRKAAEAKAKRERAAVEAKVAEERRKREALETADRERKAAEAAAEKARQKAEAEAAKAPVKARLGAWVEAFALPDLPGADHEVARHVRDKFEAFREWAKKEVGGI
jgi:hypothetical protein